MRIAHNPQTGEYLGLQGGEWKPLRTASNAKGEKLYLDVDGWKPLNKGNAETPDSPKRDDSLAGRMGRGFSFGSRNVLEGLGSIPDMLLNQPVNAIFGTDLKNPGEAIADLAGLEKAKTDSDRVLGAAVRGGVEALPTIALGGAPAVAKALPRVSSFLTAAPLTQTASGAASGAAVEGVRQSGGGTVAQIAAGLGAGLIPPSLALGGIGVGRTAKGTSRAFEALSETGRKRIAAENLRKAIEQGGGNVDAVVERVKNADLDLVPGAAPTLGQVAEDAGLAVMEKNRESRQGGIFQNRYNQQKAAQLEEAENLLSAMEERAKVRQEAFDARSGAQAGQFAAMDKSAVDELESLLPYGPSELPDSTTGAALRDRFDELYEGAKGRTREAYEAIDPEGSASFNLAPLRESFNEFLPSGQFAAPMPADVRRFVDQMDDAIANGRTASYRDLQDIRTQLTDITHSARQNGDANMLRIAGGMKQRLDDYLFSASEYADNPVMAQPGSAAYRAARREATELAKAKVAADSPMWDQVWGHLDADSLLRDFPDAKRELSQLHGRGLFARKGAGVPIDELADSLKIQGWLTPDADSSTLVEILKSKVRGKGRAAEKLDNVLESAAQYPTGFSPEQAQAFQRAKQLRREQGQLFEEGFNQKMSRGQLRDDQIPGNYFKSGPAGDGSAKDFLRAFGDSETARSLMRDYIIEKFRREALKDGALNVKAMEKWLNNHRDALWNFPEVKQELDSVLAYQKLVDETKRAATEGLAMQKATNAERNKLGAQVLKRGNNWKPKLGQREATGDFAEALRRNGVLSEVELMRLQALQKEAGRARRMAELSAVKGSPTYQNLATQAIADSILGKSLGRGKDGFIKAGLRRTLLGGGLNKATEMLYGKADDVINQMLDDAFLDPRLAVDLLEKYKPYTPKVTLKDVFKNQARGATTSQVRGLLDILNEEEPKKKK